MAIKIYIDFLYLPFVSNDNEPFVCVCVGTSTHSLPEVYITVCWRYDETFSCHCNNHWLY